MITNLEVPFGAWLPDQADYKNPGLVEANNVYPSPGGYKPLALPVATGLALTAMAKGAQLFTQNDGTTVVCAGTDTTLDVVDTTVTTTTGYSPIGDNEAWQFERFNDLIVAVSLANDPQYLTDLDTDATFSALPGSPPKAAVIGRVSDWLVLGDLVDIAGLGNPTTPNRVRWSAFNNPTLNWVTDRGNQSDYRDLDAKYGRVTGIVGGRWGLVFQERAIWRMTYVGAPKVFDFQLVADDRGCIAPNSIVTIGYETYFLDQGGFFVTNGSEVAAIGDTVLNEWFENEVDVGQIKSVHGAVNWPERCVVWSFKTDTSDTFKKQVIYSFVTGQWSSAGVFVDYLVQTRQDALTLGDLATLFPGGLASMSAFQLGTAEWQAKERFLACFRTANTSASANLQDDVGSNLLSETGDALLNEGSGITSVTEFYTFTGESAQADLVTGDASLVPGRRTLIDGVMPVIELESGQVSISTRTRALQGSSVNVSSAQNPGPDGYASQHVDGWFHSFRVTIEAGAVWDKASGLWVRARRTGKR